MRIKRTLFTSLIPLGTLFLGIPVVQAHVTWFVSEENAKTVDGFSLSETPVQGAIALVILGIFLAALLEKKLKILARFKTWTASNKDFFVWLFQMGIGISLIVNAGQGFLLIPTAPASSGWRVIEAFAGFMILFPGGGTVAAALLLLMWGRLWFSPGSYSMFEYLNWVGIALFILITKSPNAGFFAKRWQAWGAPLLRWTTGLSLLVLAFTEKLLDLPLALEFLQKYPLNFMKTVGFENFSDRLFILSAGSAEALFGLIFLIGWVTRLNTLMLGFFLVSTNLYFFANGQTQEGFTEFVGHLPILVSALLLLVYGSGEKLKIKLHP